MRAVARVIWSEACLKLAIKIDVYQSHKSMVLGQSERAYL